MIFLSIITIFTIFTIRRFDVSIVQTAVIIGILWILFTSIKEGMNEGTSQYAWFEPEGYGTSHSMISPIVKPLMYKYTNPIN